MSVRSGKETKRFPRELYKGYRIIKTEDIKYHRCVWNEAYFDKNWIDSKDVYYNFCKEGNEKLPSQDYIVVAKTIDDCKEAIDKFLEDDTLYFTKAERTKYVKAPNKKCDYAYGYDSLMKLFKEHRKADKRIKVTLVKSTIGAIPKHKATVAALGLKKLGSSNDLPDNEAIRGMCKQVCHLVKVEEA